MHSLFRNIGVLGFITLVGCGGSSTGAAAPTSNAANPYGAANPCGADDPCGAGDPCTAANAYGAANPCGAGDPCGAGTAGAEAPVDISSWSQWTKVSDQPFRSNGHRNSWVDIYVTPEHANTYRTLQAPMPQGIKIAKVQYQDAGDQPGDIKSITVMSKMAPGYDEENGDWYYGMYDAAGTQAKKHGRLEACIDCHSVSSDTDYVSGVPQK